MDKKQFKRRPQIKIRRHVAEPMFLDYVRGISLITLSKNQLLDNQGYLHHLGISLLPQTTAANNPENTRITKISRDIQPSIAWQFPSYVRRPVLVQKTSVPTSSAQMCIMKKKRMHLVNGMQIFQQLASSFNMTNAAFCLLETPHSQ